MAKKTVVAKKKARKTVRKVKKAKVCKVCKRSPSKARRSKKAIARK